MVDKATNDINYPVWDQAISSAKAHPPPAFGHSMVGLEVNGSYTGILFGGSQYFIQPTSGKRRDYRGQLVRSTYHLR